MSIWQRFVGFFRRWRERRMPPPPPAPPGSLPPPPPRRDKFIPFVI